jgi:hypothetical protein
MKARNLLVTLFEEEGSEAPMPAPSNPEPVAPVSRPSGKLPRLTFKIDRAPTGLAGVANPYDSLDVKMDGQEVGYVRHTSYRDKESCYKLQLAVEDQASSFKWVTLKKTFQDLAEARTWIAANWAAITSKFKLKQLGR